MKETRKYKQTELGLLPEDWEVKRIVDIATITTGSQNTQDKVDGGKYPFYVRSQNVERIDTYIYDTEGVVTAGDGVGTGKIFHRVRGKFGLHQRCYLMHNLLGVNVDYFYWIFSIRFYERVMSMTAKSSVDSVRREMIADMLLPIPPIEEQRRIASALTSIDNLIDSLDRLIAKKRDIKQGAMQQLLSGKKRLKGFTEPWVENRLGNIVDIKRGVRVVKGELTEDGLFPVFQNTNKPLGYFNRNNVKAGTPYVIIGGSAGQIGICERDYWAADDCAYFDCGDTISNKFLYFLLLFHEREIQSNVRSAGVPRLDRKALVDLFVYFPSLPEQQAIASVLTSMDNELSALEAKRKKYEQIKQGMMKQLLTGKIRLENASTLH